jgi:uncharacterized protein
MAGTTATADQERFVRIPADQETLLAVVTEPTVSALGAAVVLLSGRSGVTSVGRSRLFVGLARWLASLGYHVVRFDYRGVGESTGVEQPWELAAPLSYIEDAEAVVTWLQDEGFTDIRFMGTCGGSRLALHMGPTTQAATGVAMFSPIVRNYHKGEREETLPTSELVRRAFRRQTLTAMRDRYARRRYLRVAVRRLRRLYARDPRSGPKEFEWVSGKVIDDLEHLVDRGVPVLLFFGSDDDALEDWRRAQAGRLGRILERSDDLIRLEVVQGSYHALPAMDVQLALTGALERWLPLDTGGPVEHETGLS